MTETQPNGEAPPIRILIVEDNVEAADLLYDLLSMHGYVVEVEHDGPSGLARATTFKPRVGILDIGLPEMNGYELARRMRELPDLNPLLLIAITGYGQEEDRRRSTAAGFDLHLVKPAALGELFAALKAVHRG